MILQMRYVLMLTAAVAALPYVSVHIGILCPIFRKAKVADLDDRRVTVVQQSVIKLEIPARQLASAGDVRGRALRKL